MERLLGRFSPQIFALTRIIFGLMFTCHGVQKLLPYFGGPKADPNTITYVSGGIELIAGPLIALGLFTREAAFLSSGLMAAAYFKAHFHFPGGFWPLLNRGELAVAYCWFFLFVAAHGAGIWSIDSLRKRG